MTWEVGGVGMRAGLGVGVGEIGQGWAKVGRSGWVRLIGQALVIWIVGGYGDACRSRVECG